MTEDFRAYGVGNTHRHLAEMRARARGERCRRRPRVHAAPASRRARHPRDDHGAADAKRSTDPLAPWREEFAGEPFVEVDPEPPTLRDVVRRNVVRISARHVAGVRQPTLLVLSAIDNLVKGAAGQAVQNANVVLGLDEPVGLPA